jgi:hypothetical protein
MDSVLTSVPTTGYTWALSHAAVPCIIHTSSEADLAAAWRTQYLRGFYISRPLCAVNLLGFLYLASTSPTTTALTTRTTASQYASALYITAAILSASGVPYALTFLRRTNGALSIRAKKLAGPGEDPTAMALTYASAEARSLEREREWKETTRLVRRWQWHNSVRTWILVLGTVLGAVGLVLDGGF